VIPPGFTLDVFAGVNRSVVLAVGNIAVEEGLGGAFIDEIARDDDVPSRSAMVTVPV
jgi:hypothetical protein